MLYSKGTGQEKSQKCNSQNKIISYMYNGLNLFSSLIVHYLTRLLLRNYAVLASEQKKNIRS